MRSRVSIFFFFFLILLSSAFAVTVYDDFDDWAKWSRLTTGGSFSNPSDIAISGNSGKILTKGAGASDNATANAFTALAADQNNYSIYFFIDGTLETCTFQLLQASGGATVVVTQISPVFDISDSTPTTTIDLNSWYKIVISRKTPATFDWALYNSVGGLLESMAGKSTDNAWTSEVWARLQCTDSETKEYGYYFDNLETEFFSTVTFNSLFDGDINSSNIILVDFNITGDCASYYDVNVTDTVPGDINYLFQGSINPGEGHSVVYNLFPYAGEHNIEVSGVCNTDASDTLNSDLNITLDLYDYNGFFSDYNAFDGNNWVRTLGYSASYRCGSINYPADLNLLIDGNSFAYEVNDLNCDNSLHDVNGSYTHAEDSNVSVTLGFQPFLSLDANSNILSDFFLFDNTAPELFFDVNYSSGGFTAFDLNISAFVRCYDANSPKDSYFLSANDLNKLNALYDNNSIQSVTFDVDDGVSALVGSCTDLAGNSTEDTNSVTIYGKVFILINEETGAVFDLDDINGLRVYSPDKNFSFDFKDASATQVKYLSIGEDSLRFELTYDDGVNYDKRIRNFTMSVLDTNNVRVCVPEYYPTFYTHFVLSSTQRSVAVFNPFSTCYILAGKTKFAYQTAYISQVSLINMQYNLFVWDSNNTKTILGLIDGSVESTINVDALEFGITDYETVVSPDSIHVSKAYDNTLKFYYRNIQNNNSVVNIKLYDESKLLWNYTETDSPNEFTAYFDHTTSDINGDMLRIVVTRTLTDASEETFTQYFTVEGFSGALSSEFAIIIAFVMVIFSLTIVAYRFAVGWFGIITSMIGIAVLTLAPPVWYITFGQAVLVTIIIFIALIYRSETAAIT